MNTNLGGIAKRLRKRLTEAEGKLWKRLRDRQLEGLKFRRQQPMGHYVLDFVCYERGIVIEIDGGQHAMQKEKDEERDKRLNEQGFIVLRYWNNDVLTNIEGVLEDIRKHCLYHPHPRPLPSWERE
ncbi:MAG: endonuclease domain-containing protein [Armatimonadetes bacterium]|nr:endonuclease domain-containing protein [Armatimonadota bacterium]